VPPAQFVLVTALLLAPLATGWSGLQDRALGPQHDVTGGPVITTADVGAGPDALLILSYHAVEPVPRSPYSVTPAEFASQLQLLHAAGYRTVRSGDLLAAREPAGRKIAITFDDSTRGQWTYADPVLARYGFTAISFLVTGNVGTRAPGYLTWPHVERMQKSGRWEFGTHTHNLITPVVIGQRGETGSPAFNRRWLAGPGRLEAMPEYQTRIAADLDWSQREFTSRGLPAPRLLSLPVPPVASNDERVADTLRSVIQARYRAVLRDEPSVRSVTSQDRASAELPRVSVRTGTTAAALFTRLTGLAAPQLVPSPDALPPSAPPPAASPDALSPSAPSRALPSAAVPTRGVPDRAIPSQAVPAQPVPSRAVPARPVRAPAAGAVDVALPVPGLVPPPSPVAAVGRKHRLPWTRTLAAWASQAADDVGVTGSSSAPVSGPNPAGDIGSALAHALRWALESAGR
jgi:hypothetical protein